MDRPVPGGSLNVVYSPKWGSRTRLGCRISNTTEEQSQLGESKVCQNRSSLCFWNQSLSILYGKKCLVVVRYTQQSRPWRRTWKIWEYSGLLSESQSIICEDVGIEGTNRRLYVVFSTAEIGGTRLCFRN